MGIRVGLGVGRVRAEVCPCTEPIPIQDPLVQYTCVYCVTSKLPAFSCNSHYIT